MPFWRSRSHNHFVSNRHVQSILASPFPLFQSNTCHWFSASRSKPYGRDLSRPFWGPPSHFWHQMLWPSLRSNSPLIHSPSQRSSPQCYDLSPLFLAHPSLSSSCPELHLCLSSHLPNEPTSSNYVDPRHLKPLLSISSNSAIPPYSESKHKLIEKKYMMTEDAISQHKFNGWSILLKFFMANASMPASYGWRNYAG